MPLAGGRRAGERSRVETSDIRGLLRRAREAASLTQRQLAERAGMSQSVIAGFESGRRQPRIDQVARIMEALGLQLLLATEPLWARVDAEIDRLSVLSPAERVGAVRRQVDLEWLEEHLADVPHVVTGAVAAILLGAPVPVGRLQISVRGDEEAMAAFAVALERMWADRWSSQWHQWGFAARDPREPGVNLWFTLYGEIEAEIVEQLPPSVAVTCGDLTVPVLPLDRLVVGDAATARVLDRMRARLTSAA